MNNMSPKHARFRNSLLLLSGLAIVSPLMLSTALAADRRPSLIVTSEPLPKNIRDKIYNKPKAVREIQVYEVTGKSYFEPTHTIVSDKVGELKDDLDLVRNKIGSLSDELNALQKLNEEKAADYYAAVATVNTQLQSGTTPGNPRLVKRLDRADSLLKDMGTSINDLNQLAMNTSQVASEASFLLEETRSAYSLSGAVEEDHVKLAELEDTINNTIVAIERVLNSVNDDITRTSVYLSSERNNLRTLTLAVSNGDIYGKSLANRPFSSTASYQPASVDMAAEPVASPQPAVLSGPRPLVKIRFDQPDVDYEQPVYLAMSEALQRYPDARFDLVAVHPSGGNAAEVAIESTRARRNAERVLRSVTQMGLPLDRIDLSYKESAEATSNEVHIYIRP